MRTGMTPWAAELPGGRPLAFSRSPLSVPESVEPSPCTFARSYYVRAVTYYSSLDPDSPISSQIDGLDSAFAVGTMYVGPRVGIANDQVPAPAIRQAKYPVASKSRSQLSPVPSFNPKATERVSFVVTTGIKVAEIEVVVGGCSRIDTVKSLDNGLSRFHGSKPKRMQLLFFSVGRNRMVAEWDRSVVERTELGIPRRRLLAVRPRMRAAAPSTVTSGSGPKSRKLPRKVTSGSSTACRISGVA